MSETHGDPGWNCVACRFEWPKKHKFCGECGTKQSEQKPEVSEEDKRAIEKLRGCALGISYDPGGFDVWPDVSQCQGVELLVKAREVLGVDKLQVERDAARNAVELLQSALKRLGSCVVVRGEMKNTVRGDRKDGETVIDATVRILYEQDTKIAELMGKVSMIGEAHNERCEERDELRTELENRVNQEAGAKQMQQFLRAKLAAIAAAVHRDGEPLSAEDVTPEGVVAKIDKLRAERNELRRKLAEQGQAKRCSCNDACGDVRNQPKCEACFPKTNLLLKKGDFIEVWCGGWTKTKIKDVNEALQQIATELGITCSLKDEGTYWRRILPLDNSSVPVTIRFMEPTSTPDVLSTNVTIDPMTPDKLHDLVHIRHCCVFHGCKYGEGKNCPVESGKVQQEFSCPDCKVSPYDSY